jgi:hypothetical protein
LFDLSFYATHHNTLYKLPLETEEKCNGKDSCQHSPSHKIVLRSLLRKATRSSMEILESYSKGEFLRSINVDQWANEAIPLSNHCNERQGGDGWLAQRKHNLPKDTKVVGTIYEGRLIKIPRNGHDELPHQKNGKSPTTKPGRKPKWLIGIDKLYGRPFAELVKHDVSGYQRNLSGQHHGAQSDYKECIPESVSESRKTESRERACQYCPSRSEKGDDDCVIDPAKKWY